ncbi:peptidoglycan/xylan/chitin deacetylase (PgdA/CDA1 family) [Streptacidiphilus sp. BW17]|uniref:polysaccharide deacetylase family protein n=1 Tax=Streptacidiphilus sp. BW17 TaxID=3156274 RepID=UPI003516E1C8
MNAEHRGNAEHRDNAEQRGTAGRRSGAGQRPAGRRSVLRMAGVGGLLAAGGVLGTLGIRSALAGSGPAPRIPGALPWPSTSPSGIASGRPSGSPGGPRASWSELFQSGHGWTAAGQGTSSADLNDHSLFATGDQSVRVTTNGNGEQSYVHRLGMPALDLTGKMIRLVLRVDDTTHLHRLAFYVGSDRLANGYVWEYHTHSRTTANYVGSGEWVTVHLQWADVSKSLGGYALSPYSVPSQTSGFTDMSFAVYDDGGGPVTYHLQSVELIPDTASVFPRGAVSITFDDSYASVHDLARPVMDRHGYTGTIYNIAQAIGTSRFLTTNQMSSLQNGSGWEMAGHAYGTAAHALGYNQLNSQQVDADLRQLRSWLEAHRFATDHFAYPHGAFQQTTDGVPVDSIARRYFKTARSIVSETTESVPPAMPYRLKALTGLNDGQYTTGEPMSAVLGLGGSLDRCAHDGDWLILTFHELVTGAPGSSTQISQQAFASVMAAIADRGIPVVTIAKAMTYWT